MPPIDRLDLFVFDLAGTTVRDDRCVQRAFEGAAQDAGLRADSEWLRARMGWSKARVFTELLSRNEQDPSRASALVGAFERHLLAIYTESPITPTDGAHEAIAALEASGVEVAFSTGFPRVITDQILSALGWSGRINVASDEVPNGRPAPDLLHAAMRMATVADAARAVCAPAVGARTGPMRRGAPRWEASCTWTRRVRRTGPGRSQRAHRALLAAADRGLRGLPSTTWQLWKSARVSSFDVRCSCCRSRIAITRGNRARSLSFFSLPDARRRVRALSLLSLPRALCARSDQIVETVDQILAAFPLTLCPPKQNHR